MRPLDAERILSALASRASQMSSISQGSQGAQPSQAQLTPDGHTVASPSRVRRCEVAQVTGSTNDDARRAAREGAPSGALFLAEEQTQGRGRTGNAWHSPPGESIYLSVLLRPRVESQVLPQLALVAGIALARVVEGLVPSGVPVALKWPNDLYVGGKKLAGVLVEASFAGTQLGAVIVGIGLNVGASAFPEELQLKATSLRLVGASSLDRSELVASVVMELEALTQVFEVQGLEPFLGELCARDGLYGRELRVGDVAGTGAGLDREGRLLLRAAGGEVVAVVAGEPVLLGASAGHLLPRSGSPSPSPEGEGAAGAAWVQPV